MGKTYESPRSSKKSISDSAKLKPIQLRLMVPLATVLLILLFGFGVVMLIQINALLNQSSRQVLQEASGDFACMLGGQSRTLAALADTQLLMMTSPGQQGEARRFKRSPLPWRRPGRPEKWTHSMV